MKIFLIAMTALSLILSPAVFAAEKLYVKKTAVKKGPANIQKVTVTKGATLVERKGGKLFVIATRVNKMGPYDFATKTGHFRVIGFDTLGQTGKTKLMAFGLANGKVNHLDTANVRGLNVTKESVTIGGKPGRIMSGTVTIAK